MSEPTDPRTNQLFRVSGNGFVVEVTPNPEIPTEIVLVNPKVELDKQYFGDIIPPHNDS